MDQLPQDIFDMYYLLEHIDRDKLQICLDSYINYDDGMRENNINDIINRIKMTFNTRMYQKRIRTSDKKWIDENIEGGAPAPSSGLIPLCKALNERRYRRNRSVRFYRHLVRTGSAFPRLPRPLWGLAMTRQGSAVVRR